MIGIRVDVNEQVATGHIKRCIAIAKCLRTLHKELLFLCADSSCQAYLEPEHFPFILLGSRYNQLEEELECLEKLIEQRHIDSLLVDSYFVTPNYLQRLSKCTYVTYFDELYLKGYGCQQVINGLLNPPDYSKSKGKALIGPDYVALREEFRSLPDKPIRKEMKKILVTSGGTDTFHFCSRFLERALREEALSQIQFTVMMGAMCQDREVLLERYGKHPNVNLLWNVTAVSELMLDMDYAVTAAGTTLYEICAVGLPGSSYCIGDNQLVAAKAFDDGGYISYAGDFRYEAEDTLNRLICQLQKAFPMEFRKDKSQVLRHLVDAEGALRIARALIRS